MYWTCCIIFYISVPLIYSSIDKDKTLSHKSQYQHLILLIDIETDTFWKLGSPYQLIPIVVWYLWYDSLKDIVRKVLYLWDNVVQIYRHLMYQRKVSWLTKIHNEWQVVSGKWTKIHLKKGISKFHGWPLPVFFHSNTLHECYNWSLLKFFVGM